ncbi:MAG: PH domain-containing protein [Thermomicrobiales bacterium]|nr:PH domain-containing protein [Thermomicrobiales bacterium]
MDVAPGLGGRGLAAALLAAAVVAWLLAIAGAVLTWSGFELRRDGDRLLVQHGLLDRQRRSIPIDRLQGVSVREGPLRRPFGLAELRFESAGWGGRAAEGGVLFPLLPTAAAPALIAAAAPIFAPPDPLPPLTGPPPRARSRYLGQPLRDGAAAVALGIVVAGLLPGVAWWWGLALTVFAPLALLDGALGYRDTGWLLDRGRLIAREGGLTRRTTVAPLRRLQEREVRQTLFARRAGLATFVARLASRGAGSVVALRHLDAAAAQALAENLGPPAAGASAPLRESATIAREYT